MPPAPSKPICQALFLLTLLFFLAALMPLLILFVPKPETASIYPESMHCSTCEDLWHHNRELAAKHNCIMPEEHDVVNVRKSTKNRNMIERCWEVEPGMDLWGRPLADATP